MDFNDIAREYSPYIDAVDLPRSLFEINPIKLNSWQEISLHLLSRPCKIDNIQIYLDSVKNAKLICTLLYIMSLHENIFPFMSTFP